MADPQIRAIHAMAASGRFIPYRRRVFPVPNIPSVMFTSGITMDTNKTTDIVDNLDIQVLNKRVSFIFRWLAELL